MTTPRVRSRTKGDDGPVTTVLAVPNYQDRVASIAQTTVGPPMGIAYLAGALLDAGEDVALVDGNAERLDVGAVADRILEFNPRVVGFTASTPTIDRCARVVRQLRVRGYAGRVAVGGPHPSAMPGQCLEDFGEFDVAVAGEAEGRIVELVRRLQSGASLEGIPGIAWRDGGVRVDSRVPPPPDVDGLPRPARHLLPRGVYRSPDSLHAQTVVATRGCPAPCTYCLVPGMFGQEVRRRDPECVAEEIEDLVADGADWINFVDDTFTWQAGWVQHLCGALVRRGLHRKIGWQCLTRVDRVDRRMLDTLKGAGCQRVELGIECGTREGLKRLHKNVSRQQIIDAFDAAHEAGLETMALAMVNAPGEGKDGLRATWQLIRRLDPDQLQVSICTPYPGTRMYDDAKERGALRTDDWSRYRFLRSAVLDNGVLSEEEALAAQRDLQRRFWARPRVLGRFGRRFLREPRSRVAMLRTAAVAARRLLARPG